MNTWLVMLGMGVVAFVLRYSFLGLFKGEFPAWVRKALGLVPAAVLAAIAIPELVTRQGQFHVSLENPRLIAGILAGMAAWRTKSLLVTLVVGMVALWLLEAVM